MNARPSEPAGASTRASWTRYTVLAWLCLAAAIAYMGRTAIAVTESTMREEMELSETQMGATLSAFFVVYALAQIPSGWLGHVWGTRRGLPLFAACWSVATTVMSFATGLPGLVAARAAQGLAQAGLFPCAVNTVSKWFPVTERGFANGALGSFMSVGAVIGTGLTSVLIAHISWQSIFLIYGGLGFIWAIGFYLWFRDLPGEHPGVNAAELARIRGATDPGAPQDDDEEHEPTPWAAMFSSPAMWWICGQQFFRAAGYMFFASWFPTYLQETRDLTVKESGLYTTLPLLAVVVGGLMGGAASDWVLARTGSLRLARQGVAVTSLVACGVLICASYFAQNAPLAVAIISGGIFCFAIGSPCSYTITIDMGGRHVATVFSTMNMSGNLGAALFPYVVPHLKQATGSWESVLFLFGGTYLAAAVCWLLLKPEGTIFDQSLIPIRTRGARHDPR